MNPKDKMRLHINAIKEYPIGVCAEVGTKVYEVEAFITTDCIKPVLNISSGFTSSNIILNKIETEKFPIRFIITEQEYKELVNDKNYGMWRKNIKWSSKDA